MQLTQPTIVMQGGCSKLIKSNKLMTKDLIVITAKNEFGDSRTVDITNPSCEDIMDILDGAFKVLGFNNAQIYRAVGTYALKVSDRIFNPE